MRMTGSALRGPSAALSLAVLAACAETSGPRDAVPAPATTPEGDVLAPETYLLRAEGAWDGSPSLGGPWVAHPGVEAPRRVRIARADGSAAVTGALFHRDPDDRPDLLVSSDAATALGLAAGEAAALEVVALRPPPGEPPVADQVP